MTAMSDMQGRADDMGAVACLEKPFEPEALLHAVDAALAEAHPATTRPRFYDVKSRPL